MAEFVQTKQEDIPTPEWLPIVSLNNSVLFPGATAPVAVTSEEASKAIESAVRGSRLFAAVSVKSPQDEEDYSHLYRVGTLSYILRMMRGQEESTQLVVRGVRKIRILAIEKKEGIPWAQVETIIEEKVVTNTIEALMRQIAEKAELLIQKAPMLPKEMQGMPSTIENGHRLVYLVLSMIKSDVHRLQEIFETPNLEKKLRMTLKEISHELDITELGEKIQEDIQTRISKTEREYFLREQLKAIRKELGEEGDEKEEIENIRRQMEEKALPDPVKEKVEGEIKRLDRLTPASPEYSITRNYLEWLLEFPWLEETEDRLDIRRAERILNEDHFNLKKVKDRILEFLAVRKLNPEIKGPILCFVGPPGVGKTSLGQSIAKALGRKFIRLSLGGVHDEAEIRGHRRTYIGALPGTIIQQIRRSGSINPVFMLDEIDKVGQSVRGDPSSALLEVLDPAQNTTFRDNYMELDIDLSKVLFIATANTPDRIQPALRDRMEEIRLAGYTTQEKEQIALTYLIPNAAENNGLGKTEIQFGKGALPFLIQGYTREAGVRNLEREIQSICRKVAVLKTRHRWRKRKITKEKIREFLSSESYESEVARRTSRPGVATGLAWTPFGGEILFVEALPVPGGRGVQLTGKLGDVMRESARAATSLVRNRYLDLGIEEEFFKHNEIHLHVPAGAVPKDGPSAGITMSVAIASAATNVPIRKDVAMTGEITLSGLVLPIGGVKEKVLAAHRAGIKSIILPAKNKKDLEDIDKTIRKEMEFNCVENIDEVLEISLKSTSRGKTNQKPGSTSRSSKTKKS